MSNALRRELVGLTLEQSRINRRIAEIQDVLNPKRRPVAICGTESGYHRHRRLLKDPPCLACREAHAAYERARKTRTDNNPSRRTT